MELGEPDESGRRRPVPVEGSEFDIPCDVAITAIGTSANPFAKNIGGKMELNKWGYIVADEETGQTTDPVSGPAATSSPVPLRSFWRWAPARRPLPPSPRACWANNHPHR